MSKIKIEIETGNAAFAEDRGAEAARILRKLADSLDMGQWLTLPSSLIDINGNRTGSVEIYP